MRALIFLFFLTLACEQPKKPPGVTVEKYEAQGKMMNTIVTELLKETDREKLKETALATLRTRVVACTPIGQECRLYSTILNSVIQITNEREILPHEMKELENMAKEMKLESERNKLALMKQWREYKYGH